MKTFHPNLTILDVGSDTMYNTKEKRNCISIAIPSKTEWLGKKK